MTAMSRGRLKVSSSNVAALPFKIWTNLFLIAESGFHKRKASLTCRVTKRNILEDYAEKIHLLLPGNTILMK